MMANGRQISDSLQCTIEDATTMGLLLAYFQYDSISKRPFKSTFFGHSGSDKGYTYSGIRGT